MCPGPETGWAPTKRDQIDTFYEQGDFGYVKQQREEITHMCEPINQVIFHYAGVNYLHFYTFVYIMCTSYNQL